MKAYSCSLCIGLTCIETFVWMYRWGYVIFNHYVKTRVTFTVGPARPRPGKVRPRPGPQPANVLLTRPCKFPALPANYHRRLASPAHGLRAGPALGPRPGPWRTLQDTYHIVRRSKKLFKITPILLPQTPTHMGYWILSQVFMRQARSMWINLSRLDNNRLHNLNLDGQQASTRNWPRMWYWWLQPRIASSCTESQYMSSPTNFPRCQHH